MLSLKAALGRTNTRHREFHPPVHILVRLCTNLATLRDSRLDTLQRHSLTSSRNSSTHSSSSSLHSSFSSPNIQANRLHTVAGPLNSLSTHATQQNLITLGSLTTPIILENRLIRTRGKTKTSSAGQRLETLSSASGMHCLACSINDINTSDRLFVP